jgi:transposase
VINFIGDRVWLAPGYTDMRRSIDGLALVARHVIGQDPMQPAIFVFCGRRRDRLKILYWDVSGFWLLYRRLETGRFNWPVPGGAPVCIDRRQLAWLLDGLAIDQRRAHERLGHRVVA